MHSQLSCCSSNSVAELGFPFDWKRKSSTGYSLLHYSTLWQSATTIYSWGIQLISFVITFMSSLYLRYGIKLPFFTFTLRLSEPRSLAPFSHGLESSQEISTFLGMIHWQPRSRANKSTVGLCLGVNFNIILTYGLMSINDFETWNANYWSVN